MKTRKKIIGIAAFAFAAALSLGTIALHTTATEVVADAETAKFEMQDGAQVRTADPAGIRFVTDANAAYKAQLAQTYATDTYTYVWGTELTFTDAEGTAQTIDAETKKWLDDNSGWYTALVDIPATDYLTEITAQSYVKIYNGTELVHTATTSTQTRSIAYSASWALNDGYDDAILSTYTKAIPDTSVTLDKEGVTYVSTGEEIQLTATSAPANYGIAWRSSDTSVATVDKNGKVKTVGAGLATITATLGNSSDSYQVAVDYTKIDFEDEKVSPVIGSALTVVESKDTGTVANGATFDLAVSDNEYTTTDANTPNKAYGTDGLAAVSNASITVDWDWLNYVFSKQDVWAVSIDFYTNNMFAWWKVNNGSNRTVEWISTAEKEIETQSVRHIRCTLDQSDFAALTQNQDVTITFRYKAGLQFVYVDNVTVVEEKIVQENYLVTAFGNFALTTNNKVTYGGVEYDDVYGVAEVGGSATQYITVSSDYLGYLFADKNVEAITFDMMLSINNKKIQISSASNKTLDDTMTITADETLGGYVYHITLTREVYEKYAKDADMEIRYTGGDKDPVTNVTSSTFFYVDNLALVTATAE